MREEVNSQTKIQSISLDRGLEQFHRMEQLLYFYLNILKKKKILISIFIFTLYL